MSNESGLEEQLFNLMKAYQQPVNRFNYQLAGVVGGLVLLAGAAFLGYQLKPSPQTQPTPTIEEIAEVIPTDTAVAIFTPSPEPTYTHIKTSTPIPTNTPIPTPTYTATPTNTPIPPTNTPVPPTPTNTPIPPTPTNTPIPDTPPGSVLSLGQMWRQGYSGLALTEVHYAFLWADNFPVDFTYRNYSDQSILLSLNVDQFSAIDNLGNHWPTREIYNKSQWINTEVRPGGSYNSYVVFIVNEQYISKPDVNQLIVTVNELSSIQNAKWRIDIYH